MNGLVDFIATVHPYDALPAVERDRVAALLVRHEFRAGDTIYEFGDPLPGIYLIEDGTVAISDRNGDLLSQLGPGDSFGERGILRDGLAVTRAKAMDALVVWILPGEEMMRLIDAFPAVARFFDRAPDVQGRATDFATLRLGDLIRSDPVSCAADTTIADAARTMRDAGVSSIGVTEEQRLVGLVTVRDMCNRVVAAGRDAADPVSAVMTPDPITLPPDALGLDVLNLMLEHHIGHLPIVDDGRFTGMISQTDLTRIQAISSAGLLHEIAQAENTAQLVRVTGRIPDLLVQLVGANQRHEVVTRLITDVADAVTRRLIGMAHAQLGAAPADWLWAACGSQGRQEQTGLSDQDNCIIMADGTDPDDPWFRELARFVSDGLNACGYVYCPGDMMATNDRWRQPVSVWRGYFRNWIDRPSPEAQLLASVMFDLRALHGDAALIEELRHETLNLSARNSIFVAHMTVNSLGHRPPLGLMGGLATIRSGEHHHMIDMKLNGVVPVTELARVYALSGGIGAVNTRARLVEAREKGIVSVVGGSDLIDAYDLIQTTRLANQAQQIRAGQRPDNYLAPSDLPAFQRNHLRDAFVVVRGMQSAAGQGKGMLR